MHKYTIQMNYNASIVVEVLANDEGEALESIALTYYHNKDYEKALEYFLKYLENGGDWNGYSEDFLSEVFHNLVNYFI